MNGNIIADIDFILIWICVVAFVVFGIFFFKKYRSSEETQAKFYLGLAAFCLCFAIMRMWFLFSDFVEEGIWAISSLGPFVIDADFYWRLAAIFGIGAVLGVLFVIERYMVKTRYIITLITSIGLVIALVFPVTPIGRTATYIFTPIGVLGIIGLYAYLIKNSAGLIRTKTILAMVGIFIIFLGFVADTDFGQSIFALPIEIVGIIATVCMLIGGLIFVQGYRMQEY